MNMEDGGMTPLSWAKDNNDQAAVEFIKANGVKDGLIDKFKGAFFSTGLTRLQQITGHISF